MKSLMSFTAAVLVLVGLAMAPAQAQQDDGQTMQRLGDWEVHYSAFPSTFLMPEIAERYDLTRSNARGVVNIAVLDATSDDRAAQRVNVNGYALNDVGQRRNLEFRRHIDGDAIYYITQVPHGEEDKLRFFISISQGGTEEELTFEHTFYRN